MVRHRETSSVALARCAFPENKVENKKCRMRAISPEWQPLVRVYVTESKQKGGRRGILKTDVQIALQLTIPDGHKHSSTHAPRMKPKTKRARSLAPLVETLKLEAFCGRERSGSPQPKS
jgi:hypothetical protein